MFYIGKKRFGAEIDVSVKGYSSSGAFCVLLAELLSAGQLLDAPSRALVPRDVRSSAYSSPKVNEAQTLESTYGQLSPSCKRLAILLMDTVARSLFPPFYSSCLACSCLHRTSLSFQFSPLKRNTGSVHVGITEFRQRGTKRSFTSAGPAYRPRSAWTSCTSSSRNATRWSARCAVRMRDHCDRVRIQFEN